MVEGEVEEQTKPFGLKNLGGIRFRKISGSCLRALMKIISILAEIYITDRESIA